ncbi:MAG TPA: hemerythrin domain-containing protein [Holophagaceae bacterium]|nr:hemerythrin domain-containing protein [Holophagaceae bacterium]
MASTRLFRDQHEELKRLMGILRVHLGGTALGEEAFLAFKAYADKLREHLAMEDRGIYPRLLAHADEQVRLTAQIYQAEMGSLDRDFDAMAHRWDELARVQESPLAFTREMEAILDRLEQRMEREDHGLYALVDRLQ